MSESDGDETQYFLDRISVLEEESRTFQMQCRSLRLVTLNLERLLEEANREIEARAGKANAFDEILAELAKSSPSIEALKEIVFVSDEGSIAVDSEKP